MVSAEQAEDKDEIFPINQTLKEYVDRLVEDEQAELPKSEELKSLKLLVTNDADSYLLGILEGALLYQDRKYQLANEKFEQIKELEERLAQEQLDRAEFRILHKLLAESYATQSDFDKAFVAKQKYLVSLFHDIEVIDGQRIETLEKKYQLEQKNKTNLLLEEQSRLKKLKLVEVNQKQVDKERGYWALICVFIVFVLLMLRQLSIRRRLLWLAQVDSLTSLKNRSTLFDEGVSLFEQATEKQHSLSAILIDIDHFKQVNDQYGHAVGDNVLKRIAKLSKEVMRSRDLLARLGGEEFVALLPSANLKEAKAIAVRLKDKVAQEAFEAGDKLFNVTVSIGVVEFTDGMADIDEFIRFADQAMYLAKANGRNQVVTSKGKLES